MERKYWRTLIKRDFARQQKEHISSWLANSKNFDHSKFLHEKAKPIVENLFNELVKNENIYNLEGKMQDLQILLANLCQSEHSISISMDNNKWTKSIYHRASRYTLELLERLKSKNYIEMETGFYFPNGDAKTTRIWAGEKLLKLLEPTPENILYKPVSVIELKTDAGRWTKSKYHRKKSKKIYELTDFRYPDFPKLYRVRDILEKTNAVNNAAKIEFRGHKLNVSLVAIYLDDFNSYGRLHARGTNNYQQLSGDEKRREILINGEPTVELDFKSLHPMLLYAKEGIQFPLNKDPYKEVSLQNELRPFLKQMLLVALNCESEHDLVWSLIAFLEEDEVDFSGLRKEMIPYIKKFILDLKKVHPAISKYFFQGRKNGLKIMNLDSKICLDIVGYFAEKAVPILPIHDSFVIQEKYKDELKKIMLKMYQKHTGFSINITEN